MSSMTARSGALAVLFLLLLSCVAFVSPVFAWSDASEQETETIVIVTESKSETTLTELVIDYAKVYSEVKENVSNDRNVVIDDRHSPMDEQQRDVVQKMRDIIGTQHFCDPAPPEPKDGFKGGPEGKPSEMPPMPKKEGSVKVVNIEDSDARPSAEFLDEVVNYIEEMGTPEANEASETIRQYITWLILENLNDTLSGAVVSLNDRKDDDVVEDDINDSEPVMVEVVENDAPEPMPDVVIPPSLSDVSDVDMRPYYSGVTTCGLSFL